MHKHFFGTIKKKEKETKLEKRTVEKERKPKHVGNRSS